MSDDNLSRFHTRLNLSRNGGGLLFCGAGFSADCLSFGPDQSLGTGAQLLEMFNAELEQSPPFRDLKNAADALWEKKADHGMLALLKDRFTVSDVTTDMTDLLRFPWQTIYTTNYDNALELAANAANIRAELLNNTDDPRGNTVGLPIIHLHGYVRKWDIHNIRDSCVLGAESYRKLTQVKQWLPRFQQDVDQAQIVVFVGFNAGDFHLNLALNDLTGLREKAFFINRPTAKADPDVAAAQKRLGTVFYIGRSGLAKTLNSMLKQDAPKEPRLASFSKFTPEPPAPTVPTAQQIEDLFLFGTIEKGQLARDSINQTSEYHAQRQAVDDAAVAIDRGTRIVLFSGHPCDGKTLLTEDLSHRLSVTRPVYTLRLSYDSLLNEVADILHHAPNAALVIENCFDLPVERLECIARQFDGSEGILILTSRAVAVDASPAGMVMLQTLNTFRQLTVERLTSGEARALSDLADQIAGWRDFRGLDSNSRLRFIQETCRSSLPHFLMRLLRSEYVTGRYREEFNKLSLNKDQRFAVIIALYFSHIGENAPVSFLSNTMEVDFGAIIDGLNSGPGNNDVFRLVRRNGAMIEAVPSIGAENILANLFQDAEIVDAVVPILKKLSNTYRNPFEQRMFNQMMRFSILTGVVSDQRQIERFFDHNKQEQQIRRMPLFWLQWHMAKSAAGEFAPAEKYLEQGYAEASEYERRTGGKFDRRQLDDRRAKFLMLRAERSERTGAELFRNFKEACELTGKILRQDDPQHYPFQTLKKIYDVYNSTRQKLMDEQRPIVMTWIRGLREYAEKRLNVLPDGYQKDMARRALASLPQDFIN